MIPASVIFAFDVVISVRFISLLLAQRQYSSPSDLLRWDPRRRSEGEEYCLWASKSEMNLTDMTTSNANITLAGIISTEKLVYNI
jgi:hypothetical protein